MKLPRDVNGDELVRALVRLGYAVVRQTSSHVRLKNARQQPVTVPMHNAIKVGALAGIVDDVADQMGLTRDDVLERLRL